MPRKRKRGETDGNRQVSSCSFEHAGYRVKCARSSDCDNEGDEKGQCEEHPTCPPPPGKCVDVRDSAREGQPDSRQRPQGGHVDGRESEWSTPRPSCAERESEDACRR